MGITRSNIKLIAKALKNKGVCGGSALVYSVLGVQGGYSEVARLLSEEGYPAHLLAENERVMDSITQFGTTIHVSTLLKMLGYERSETLDLFPDERPDIIADLNTPFPADLWNRFDLVIDSGTAEHCFNIKEVLGNAVRALKVGGVVMHILPMSGWVGHGFYQFSPDVFSAFYKRNGFSEIEIMIELRIGFKMFYFVYDPEKPLPGDFWGIPAQVFFVARKVRGVVEILNPNQSVFDLPLDHPLRVGKKKSPLFFLVAKILPDVFKKYLCRKLFFMRTTIHPL